MPISLTILIVLFAYIFIKFLASKKPIYQVMGLGFLLILAMTNKWANAWDYVNKTLQTSLLYTIFAFIALSKILSETHVIDDCIDVILSLLGRLPGGAGYVSIVASSFMGAVSGSGPGNVAATGVITIPAMKKTGFPAHLAANVEASASTLGNMIPPSGIIVASFGCLTAYFEANGMIDAMSIGQFWIILWGIAIWFVIQRLITLFVFAKIYKLKPMDRSELPSLRVTIKKGWKSLLLPLVILIPFILDFFFKDTFFTARIGEAGAKSLSSSLLLFIPGMAAIYSILIARDKEIKKPKNLIILFEKTLKSIVPTLITLVFAYSIGEVLNDIKAGEEIATFIGSFNMSKTMIAFVIPLFTAFLGMIFPGSSQIAIFGPSLVTIMVASGINPVLAAGMLPCVCGAMSGIIPPVAVCTLTAMSIAESEMKPTMTNCFIWVAIHYVVSVIMLLGWLPVIGL